MIETEKKERKLAKYLQQKRTFVPVANKKGSLRNAKKIIKKHQEAMPDKKLMKNVAKKARSSAKNYDYSPKNPQPHYPKIVQKLNKRIVRLQNCYEGNDLTYLRVEQAVVDARFLGVKNPKKHRVVNEYFKILNFVGVETKGAALIKKLHAYYLQKLIVPKRVFLQPEPDPNWLQDLLIQQARRLKNKKKKKSNRSKKINRPRYKWRKNHNAVVPGKVAVREFDVKDLLKKCPLLIEKFEKILSPENSSKTGGFKNCCDFSMSLCAPKDSFSVEKDEPEPIEELRKRVLTWKRLLKEVCFREVKYYQQPTITDLLIKPEYFPAEGSLRNLLDSFDELLDSLTVNASTSENNLGRVINFLKGIDALEKPLLRKVI